MKTEQSADTTTDGVEPARIGSPSAASLSSEDALPAEGESARPAEPITELEGWHLDPFDVGFRVARSASKDGVHLVLSAGEMDDGGERTFHVPAAVLRWLLTGEQ